MKLEEKITLLRKRSGWSQEELAFRLDVSRQAVSKWEMGSSIPDLDKIIKMSELFSVTTDYLLKDEQEEVSSAVTPSESDETKAEKETPVREVTDEECSNFLSFVQKFKKNIALGIMLCILSPMLLLVLYGMFEQGILKNEGVASGFGIAGLFLMVAGGVWVLVRAGIAFSNYSYLLENRLIFSPQTEKKLRDESAVENACFGKRIAGGVVLCILSVLPIIIAGCFDAPDYILMYCCALLFPMIAMGVYIFICNGIVRGMYEKLLLRGDGSTHITIIDKSIWSNSPWSSVYWCLIIALYLGVSFWTHRWDRTWIIWIVAIAIDSAISEIVKAANNKKKNKEQDEEENEKDD